ncbi:MAG TPA: sigma factor-like helix-turn-helix DNA-binding protein [Longimicrobiales bacterium]|nr:sigma factor-like helix-turn-helix DNA-binding protein [Longimicrobiales bacterium]
MGLSRSEIAEVLSVSEHAVECRISRARKDLEDLREWLHDEMASS